MNNTVLREQFNRWHLAAYEPSLTRLSKEIGIHRTELSKWRSSKIEFGEARLNRIKSFLGGKQ